MQITAAVARAKNAPLSLEEVSLAEPRADEVLVRLVAAGICHTDISMRDHIIYPVPHPVVLGHEGAGIVERIGAGVTRLAPGDPVILTSAFCGHCPSCDAGLPIYCYEFNDRNFTGTRIDGSSPLSEGSEVIHYYQGQSSFATHAVIRERSVVKAPKDAPLEMLAPLGCGIMTGAGAVINSLGVDIDDSVAVFGTGSVGLSARKLAVDDGLHGRDRQFFRVGDLPLFAFQHGVCSGDMFVPSALEAQDRLDDLAAQRVRNRFVDAGEWIERRKAVDGEFAPYKKIDQLRQRMASGADWRCGLIA